GSGTVTVTVNPLPVVNTTPATICVGLSGHISASGGTTYSWNPSTGLSNPNVSNPLINPTTTTTYSVIVTDVNGCVSGGSATVTVNPLPVVNTIPASICIGLSGQISASGGTSYTWSPSASLSNPNISNPTASPTVTTTYSVTVADANGCVNTG